LRWNIPCGKSFVEQNRVYPPGSHDPAKKRNQTRMRNDGVS